MKRWLAMGLMMVVFGMHGTTAHAQKQLVVIDTDAGDDIDDAFALALAVRSPELDVLGVTTTYGDTKLRAHLVLHLLADAGKSKIPVAAGEPNKAYSDFSQTAYAKADNHALGNESAAGMILRAAHEHPGQVTLLAIGPLMNVGAAIDRDPQGFRALKRVVVMAGSIEHGYRDDGGAPSSEWNVRRDPSSLRKLLASGVPVTMLPLDSTQIEMPKAMQEKIAAQTDPLSHALTELVHEAHRKIVLYDVLTTACVIEESLCPTKPMRLAVDDAGYTKPIDGAPNVAVCLQAREEEFLALLEQRLTTRGTLR